MPAKRASANNHLQEAMALLINNQAALLAQIARNDKERLKLEEERLALERRFDERQRKIEEQRIKFEERHLKAEGRLLNIDEWIRKSDERFARIEAQLRELPEKIIQAVLDELPRIKKEIGFKT
jgi:hypothetical protein